MPRIRTIKPDHWEDENWNNISLQAHLLFIGMKNFADDRGVIRDNAVLIKNKVFPTREDIRTTEVSKWLIELVSNSFLVPLEFDGKGYYVLDFANEKIDKPQPSILPDEAFLNVENENREHSRTFDNVPAGEESKGEEKESKRKGEDTRVTARDEIQKKIDFPFSDPDFKVAWDEWKSYKKTEHRFNYKSVESEQEALNLLKKLSKNQVDYALKILKKSISNGWKGFFELKKEDLNGNNNNLQRKSKAQAAIDSHNNFIKKYGNE